MMPGPASSVIYAPYTGARRRNVTRFMDYEDGGVAVLDVSKGLDYQVWRARVEPSGDVYLGAPEVPEFLLLQVPGCTEISFTWDNTMRPVLAYMQGGLSKLWYYNTLTSMMDTLVLPAGNISPKVSLDDKRVTQTSASDVILAYVRDGSLYWREQRDRYLVERLWSTGLRGRLLKLGMNNKLRLQAQVTYE